MAHLFRYDDAGHMHMDPASVRPVLLDMIDQVRRTGHTLPVKAGGHHPLTAIGALTAAYEAVTNEGEDMTTRPAPAEIVDLVRTLSELRASLSYPHHRDAIDQAVAIVQRYRALADPSAVYGTAAYIEEIEEARRLLSVVEHNDGDPPDWGLAVASVHAQLACAMATAAVARRPPC